MEIGFRQSWPCHPPCIPSGTWLASGASTASAVKYVSWTMWPSKPSNTGSLDEARVGWLRHYTDWTLPHSPCLPGLHRQIWCQASPQGAAQGILGPAASGTALGAPLFQWNPGTYRVNQGLFSLWRGTFKKESRVYSSPESSRSLRPVLQQLQEWCPCSVPDN